MNFLAQSLERFTPGAIGWTVMGVAAALSLAALVLTVLLLGRAWFRKQPTFHEILKTLMPVTDFEIYKEEQRRRDVGLETQISAARHAFDEALKADFVTNAREHKEILRRGDARDGIISTLRDSMAAMQERTATHIRQFDALFKKCDTLLERLPHEGRRYPKPGE
jgi:hypothetical protein